MLLLEPSYRKLRTPAHPTASFLCCRTQRTTKTAHSDPRNSPLLFLISAQILSGGLIWTSSAGCFRTAYVLSRRIWTADVGNPYEPNNLVMRVLHPTLNALGLTKTGWRAFRRSVATALSEMREPVRTAQQILGHASAQTTLAYYVQTVEESQRSAILRLEEIMFPSWRQAK
jgi:hypothetical protein